MTTPLTKVTAALEDRYSIQRELGGGGMSRIFLATERALGREVVVKIIAPELAAGLSAERFAREVKLAARLQQANIVPVLTAGEAAGLPYYTMPFVRGESLRTRIARGDAISVGEVVGILRDVARALAYAHAEGIVHRDIKPENILLSGGTAVVTDFGIAKAVSASMTLDQAADVTSAITQLGSAIGTPAYMAPEQSAGDPGTDQRADLYAWGLVAWELLAGRHPFSDRITPQALLAAHLSETPVHLGSLRAGLPASLSEVVQRCLEKDPAKRPASAAELLQVLENVTTPTSASGQPAASAPAGRRSLGVVLTAVALLAVVAFVISRILGGGSNTSSVGSDRSVAVLPLANLSGDPADDYFGIGLSEEITRALAKAGIRVIGRVSAGALQARGLDQRAIATELRVGSLLTGSVQRAAGQVRISVALSAADGAVRWTQAYDRPLANVFAVQDEIAREVSRELLGSLSGTAPGSLVRDETADPEAHSLLLQGSALWNRRTEPAIRQAIALFERAVARDPGYARAHAWLGLANNTLPWYTDAPTGPLLERALAETERALAIDSTVSEAHTSAGAALMMLGRNADAEARFRHALAIDSTFATTWGWYNLLDLRRGDFDAARRKAARGIEFEPASLVARFQLAQALMVARRYAEADSAASSVIALDSSFAMAWRSRAETLVGLGRVDEAIGIMEQRVVGNAGLGPSHVEGILAWMLARAGRPADARRVLQRLREVHGGRWPPVGSVAAALAELGELDEAVAVLGDAIAQHDSWLFLSRSARFDRLRADPRAAALLAPLEKW